MSSSDSEDDCYANVAQKLQKMKNRYKEDKFDSTNLLNDSSEIDKIVKNAETIDKTPEKHIVDSQSCSESAYSDVASDLTVETVPATSHRQTRSSTRNSITVAVATTEAVPALGARGRRNTGATPNRRATPRGRRGRGNQSVNTGVQDITAPSPRTPRRGRGSRRRAMFDAVQAMYPIYSVGNTYEYPDQSESQQLFSGTAKDDDIVVVEDNDPLDDNEELSVKVYWQSSEYFKFTIRRFQKITQIFQYFSKKENVDFDKLLFTFKDKILKPDDTPESINYNIVKFIDGGVVNKSVSKLQQDSQDVTSDGIRLKFQCQNLKKPFETFVSLNDKLSVAMLKCAEHFEKPLDKLRFIFDGDSLSSKTTARELDFEGDECIDVKILS